MTTVLIMLGLVTLIAWSYALVGALSYVLLFRKAYSGDRLFLSSIWPVSVPMAAVYRVRLQLRRWRNARDLAKAQVRRGKR